MRAYVLPRVPYRERTDGITIKYPTPNELIDNATEAAILQRLDTPRYGGTVPRLPVETE